MKSKKQSSIDWLVEQWATQGTLYSSDLEQAKQLHKQETMDDYKSGSDYRATTQEAEQYYKDTYETDN